MESFFPLFLSNEPGTGLLCGYKNCADVSVIQIIPESVNLNALFPECQFLNLENVITMKRNLIRPYFELHIHPIKSK
jgi:hypothetical protein